MIIRLPKLYTRQREIAEEIINSDAMYAVVCSSRQSGKSFMLKALAIYYAGNNSNTCTLIISMTYQQLLKIFNELTNSLRNTPLLVEANKSEWTIRLTNGSEILFRSYQNLDRVRGYSVDYLLVDEAAFCKETEFNAALRPTLTVKGKKCILVSTPKGRNYFYKLWAEGKNGNPNYVSFHSDYTQNPFANLSEVEDARRLLPENIFKAEYEALFTEEGITAFKGFRACVGLETWEKGEIFAAVDVGKLKDSSVLVVMDGNKVIFCDSYKQISYTEICKRIAIKLKELKVKQCYVETNGVGEPMLDMLRDATSAMTVTIHPWVTTNKSKNNAVERLIQDITDKNICLPDHEQLLYQMSNFEAHYSPKTHALVYENRNDNDHDDFPMALSICNYVRHRGANYARYAIA